MLNIGSDESLLDLIKPPSYYLKGRVKCRISYDHLIREIDYQLYQPRKINAVKIVLADDIDYAHKYEDRTQLKKLFDLRDSCDEVLIIKEGNVTDCFYYNVAFYDGSWWTPKTPLLPGTERAKLVDNGKLTERYIGLSDIKNYQKIALFNALNPFGETVLNIDQLH